MYIVVRQHEVGISAEERKMPFRTIRVTTTTTPDLDPPDIGAGAVEVEGIRNQSAFCPHVGGQPFLFHVVAEDWEGRRCEFTAPLIFLDSTVDENATKRETFSTRTW